MTGIQMASAAAALIVATWPQIKDLAKYAKAIPLRFPSKPVAPQAPPSYREAIESLAGVRMRLRATECFSDQQKSAIDVLTLALVEGSDK